MADDKDSKLVEFASITQLDASQAKLYLEQADWDIPVGIDLMLLSVT